MNFNPVNESKTILRKTIERDYEKLIHPDTVLDDIYVYRPNAFGDTIRNFIKNYTFDS